MAMFMVMFVVVSMVVVMVVVMVAFVFVKTVKCRFSTCPVKPIARTFSLIGIHKGKGGG